MRKQYGIGETYLTLKAFLWRMCPSFFSQEKHYETATFVLVHFVHQNCRNTEKTRILPTILYVNDSLVRILVSDPNSILSS